MSKSKRKPRKNKKIYRHKEYMSPDMHLVQEERKDEISPEIKQRLIDNSGFADKDSLVFWEAVPEKMSEILMNYAEPLLKEDINESEIPLMKDALTAALLIWNYAIVKKAKTKRRLKLFDRIKMRLVIEKFLIDAGKKGQYAVMMKRKQELYPDNQRIISNIDVSWDSESDGLHLVVLSSIDKRISLNTETLA